MSAFTRLNLLNGYGGKKMNINNIKQDRKKKPGATASIQINIRITPQLSKWLKGKQYSPTGIFQEAIKELGYKPKL